MPRSNDPAQGSTLIAGPLRAVKSHRRARAALRYPSCYCEKRKGLLRCRCLSTRFRWLEAAPPDAAPFLRIPKKVVHRKSVTRDACADPRCRCAQVLMRFGTEKAL